MAPQSKAKVPFKANDSKEKFPQICRQSFYLILFITKLRDFFSGRPQIMAKSFKLLQDGGFMLEYVEDA